MEIRVGLSIPLRLILVVGCLNVIALGTTGRLAWQPKSAHETSAAALAANHVEAATQAVAEVASRPDTAEAASRMVALQRTLTAGRAEADAALAQSRQHRPGGLARPVEETVAATNELDQDSIRLVAPTRRFRLLDQNAESNSSGTFRLSHELLESQPVKHSPSSKDFATLDRMLAPVATEGWTAESAACPTDAEKRRVEQLRQLGVLDTPRERLFQSFVEQALKVIPGTAMSAVSMVDLDRQWFKAMVGSDLVQTPREQSFCSHTIQTNGVLIVNDATADARFTNNQLVTGSPNIRFYAGVKLTRAVGALCVIGTQPRDISRAEISKLVQLAQFIDIQLLTVGALSNLGITDGSKREG